METIGDCYGTQHCGMPHTFVIRVFILTVVCRSVAVCGCPEARQDHAVVMARFARDCRHAMGLVVKKLEVILGPDTSDLAIRIGKTNVRLTLLLLFA